MIYHLLLNKYNITTFFVVRVLLCLRSGLPSLEPGSKKVEVGTLTFYVDGSLLLPIAAALIERTRKLLVLLSFRRLLKEKCPKAF
jgi:hypothetical protein